VVVSVVKEMRAVAKDYVEAIKTSAKMADTVLLSLPMPLAFVNASVGTLARIYACILTRCERQHVWLTTRQDIYMKLFSDVRRTLLQVCKLNAVSRVR